MFVLLNLYVPTQRNQWDWILFYLRYMPGEQNNYLRIDRFLVRYQAVKFPSPRLNVVVNLIDVKSFVT